VPKRKGPRSRPSAKPDPSETTSVRAQGPHEALFALLDPWAAEIVVDPDLAQHLIETQFPHLRPVSVRSLAAGWDNTVHLVNGSFIFRFPRRKIAVPLIESEVALLPWLRSQLPLEVPVPAFVGRPSPQYPWPFAGHGMVPGRPLPAARLSLGDRTALARPLAQFLAALHSISADAARRHGAGPDLLDRLDVGRRVRVTRERLSGLVRMNVINDKVRRSIEDLLEAAPSVATPRSDTLVHGDLHAGQILLGNDGQLTGVIDWGDAHVGDPAVDLAVVRATLPQESHAAFLQEYGQVSRTAWLAARARAVWHTVALLAHASDLKEIDMIEEAKEALGRLVSAGAEEQDGR
jgi:aminoglycoside phosphotransferase (APT) family kinase protein